MENISTIDIIGISIIVMLIMTIIVGGFSYILEKIDDYTDGEIVKIMDKIFKA